MFNQEAELNNAISSAQGKVRGSLAANNNEDDDDFEEF